MTTAEQILLVDDDSTLLAGLEKVLRKQFQVKTATSGMNALEIIANDGPFAVVVSDLKMPGMDGLELFGLICEKYPSITNIMLSGEAELEDAINAVNQGLVFRFFTKPVDRDVLASALQEAIQNTNAALAAQAGSQTFFDSDYHATDTDVIEQVADKLEHASEEARRHAASTLLGIEQEGHVVTTNVFLHGGELSGFDYARFDNATSKKIRHFMSILGDSPEVVAKVDVLKLGKVASTIYSRSIAKAGRKTILDVHFSTLYHRSFAETYLRICRSLMASVRESIAFNIVDLSNDVLPSRAYELINRLRPFCSHIFVNVSNFQYGARFISEQTSCGLTLDYEALKNVLAHERGDAKKLIEAFKKAPAPKIVLDVENEYSKDVLKKLSAGMVVFRS